MHEDQGISAIVGHLDKYKEAINMKELLNNVDREATQKNLENVFRQYRTYLLTTDEDLMPKLTTRFTLEMPNFSEYKESKTEIAVIKKITFEENYEKFMKWFNRGFNRLNKIERQIITKTNLVEEPKHNYEIYRELHLTERTFYRIKSNALYKLALFLGIIVYEEKKKAVKPEEVKP